MMNNKTAEEIPLEAKGALEMPEKDKKLKKKKEDEKEPVETNGQEAQEADEAAKEVQQEKIEELNKKIAELEKEVEKQKDLFQRTAAEYDNYRKRTAKEKEQIYSDAKMATVKEFLGVYDNLERAVAQEGDDDSPHKKGMEMIFHQLEEILKKMGVEKIDAAGKPFDPDQHSAVMHIEDETLEPNTVAEVFQQGFTLGGRVIRFAVVKVAN